MGNLQRKISEARTVIDAFMDDDITHRVLMKMLVNVMEALDGLDERLERLEHAQTDQDREATG